MKYFAKRNMRNEQMQNSSDNLLKLFKQVPIFLPFNAIGKLKYTNIFPHCTLKVIPKLCVYE